MRTKFGEGYITVAEAARRKGISRAAMYQAIKNKRIPHTKFLDTTTVLAEQDVEAFQPRARRSIPLKDTRPLWQKIVDIGQSIPLEEWARVPRDASKHLDHY